MEKKQKRKQKHCHGLTRKRNTSFRAGCVSDGINILFGKGPFDRLRDRGSFGGVSELAELAVKLR
jgi:hypothetical protein